MPLSNPSLPTVPDGLHVDGLTLDPSGLSLLARTTAAQAICPTCGYSSSRVRSRYWRTLQDLPWQDRAVTWRVQVRRFRCNHCPGRIFVERTPGLMGSQARRTERLSEAQTEIGMVLGGEAGASLSRRLCMPVSGETVLRLIRRHPPRAYPAPRVVGIATGPGGSDDLTAPSSAIWNAVAFWLCCRVARPLQSGTGSRRMRESPSSARTGQAPTTRPPAAAPPLPSRSPTAGTFWSTPPKPSVPSLRATRHRSSRRPDFGLLPVAYQPCPLPRRLFRNGARTAVGASTMSCVFMRRVCPSCRSRTGPGWPATPCAAT